MGRRSERELEDLARAVLRCGAAEALGLLPQLGFREPARASQALDRLAGEPPFLAPLPPGVLVALALAGRPDQGLRHLERFVEITGSRLALYARLEESPRLTDYLARVLSHSRFLTDILVRNPEYLYWLFEETPFLAQPLDKQTLRELVRRQLESEKAAARRLETLRRIQRRELLRIGVAEVLGLKEVAQVGRELADLADVVLEVVLEEVTEELARRYGRPRDERGQAAHFCAVCLGKHGGQELNYSSDVDLLFVYDEEGHTRPAARGGGGVSNHEFFNRLGNRLVQLLTEVTAEGFLYRVDMRLRPEGEAGPLVRSLHSFWVYYETRGELWERQMLIKARRGAGSPRVWKRFREMLAPFIYPAHFLVSPQEEIRRIKERIEAQILERPSRDNHLKLRAGGIRDIEFIVQCLQLLNGRINPQARSHNTLEAIGQLERAGALSPEEAAPLRRAYTFFRRLENLLQIEEGRSIYALPQDQEQRQALAWLLGLPDPPALQRELEAHLERVRRIYENLFYAAPAPAAPLGWLLEAEPGSPRAGEALAQRGFADGEAAHRHLLQLAAGGTSAARQHLEELLPELLASLAVSADPDQALVRFAQIVGAYGAPGTFYGLLHAHSNFRTLLIAICGSSPFLAELVRRDPGLLDGLVSQGSDPDPGWPRDLGAIQRHRSQELLRIGTEDLLGLATEEQTFLRLTELAEEILKAVYGLAWRRLAQRRGRPRDRRGRDAHFACFAAGKFGGRELDFGSDLDLFFVYQGEGQTGRTRTENAVFFTELAQELMRLLAEGNLYKVDARLRPEGRNAPVVVEFAAYRHYLAHRAALWERLALSRARPVAGDPELGQRVQRAIWRFVFGRPVDAATAREVLQMRARLEPRPESSLKRGKGAQVDIKRGPGGIVDLEFIAQILVLKTGRKQRELRLKSTRQILSRLALLGYFSEGAGQFLIDAYDRLREIEKGMRLASDQAENVLPTGRQLASLARTVGQGVPEELVSEVAELMWRTRGLFTRIFAGFTGEG